RNKVTGKSVTLFLQRAGLFNAIQTQSFFNNRMWTLSLATQIRTERREKNERGRIRGRGIGRADCAFKRELSAWPVSLGQPSTCSGQQQPERGSWSGLANDAAMDRSAVDAAHPPGLLGYEGQPGATRADDRR